MNFQKKYKTSLNFGKNPNSLLPIDSVMDSNLMITVSGGRSSAIMAKHINESPKYKKCKKIFVFCNTGMERPETIDFLKKIENEWNIPLMKIEGVYSNVLGVGVKYKVVDWDNINMTALPFSQSIMHKNKGVYDGLPHSRAPYCSDMLKTQPAKKLCDAIFGVNNYIKAIGFRKEDMPKRISYAEIKEDKKRIFPLITDFYTPISQSDLNNIFKNENFKLEIHNNFGNCELCWKKSQKTLIENIRAGTRFIDWYIREEKKYGNTSFRENKSIRDLEKLAKQPTSLKMDFKDDYKCVCSF